jgi:hypothetical protein
VVDDRVALGGEALGQRALEPVDDQTLGRRERGRVAAREGVDDLGERGLEARCRRRAVREAPGRRVGTREAVAGEDVGQGALAADQARQALRRPATGDLAVAQVVVGDDRVVADDHDVAGLHELEAARGRRALDGDHRHVERGDRGERGAELVEEHPEGGRALVAQALDLGDVAAGAEVPADPADDQHARPRGEVGQRRSQPAGETHGDGVARVRAIEPHAADDTVEIAVHRLVHPHSSPSVSECTLEAARSPSQRVDQTATTSTNRSSPAKSSGFRVASGIACAPAVAAICRSIRRGRGFRPARRTVAAKVP